MRFYTKTHKHYFGIAGQKTGADAVRLFSVHTPYTLLSRAFLNATYSLNLVCVQLLTKPHAMSEIEVHQTTARCLYGFYASISMPSPVDSATILSSLFPGLSFLFSYG